MTKRSWIRRLFTRPVARTIRKATSPSRPALEVLEGRWVPSTLVVTNPTDTPVTGLIDLRQAIAMANTNVGDDTITFDTTVFKTPQTITLGGTQLELSDTTGPETITGPKAGVTVNGGGLSRVFQVDGLVTASISGVTITGGNSGYYNGGGVNNYGSLTLTNCTVSGNSGGLFGGGVQNSGSLALTNCTVSGNSASLGGGLSTNYGGTATLTNCTVSGNSARYGGGLVNYYGSLALTNCTVSGNSATYSGGGGGVFSSGNTTTLGNTIVAGNGNKDVNFGPFISQLHFPRKSIYPPGLSVKPG
jgi:hypothetical protein